MTAGEQIRSARKSRGMSARALARELGISAPHLCDVEHDRKRLSEAKLQKAAELLALEVVNLSGERTLSALRVEDFAWQAFQLGRTFAASQLGGDLDHARAFFTGWLAQHPQVRR